MSNFPQLKDEEIKSILLYVNDVYTSVPVATTTAGGGAEEKDAGTPWMFVALAAMLALLAFAMMRIVDNLNNVNRVREGQAPINRTTWQIMSTKGFVAFSVFALVLLSSQGIDCVNLFKIL